MRGFGSAVSPKEPRHPPLHCSPWGFGGGAEQALTCSCSPTRAPVGTPPPKSQPTEKPTQDNPLARPNPTELRPGPQPAPLPEGLAHLPTGRRLTAQVEECLSRPKTKAPGEGRRRGAGWAHSTLPCGGSASSLVRVGPWGPREPFSYWLAGRGAALVRAWQLVTSLGTGVPALRHEGALAPGPRSSLCANSLASPGHLGLPGWLWGSPSPWPRGKVLGVNTCVYALSQARGLSEQAPQPTCPGEAGLARSHSHPPCVPTRREGGVSLGWRGPERTLRL